MNQKVELYLQLYDHHVIKLNRLKEANFYPETKMERVLGNSAEMILAYVEAVSECERYIAYVQGAKALLGEELYMLLMNDHYQHAHWYERYYNRGTYYRKRKKAYGTFLDYMAKYNS